MYVDSRKSNVAGDEQGDIGGKLFEARAQRVDSEKGDRPALYPYFAAGVGARKCWLLDE